MLSLCCHARTGLAKRACRRLELYSRASSAAACGPLQAGIAARSLACGYAPDKAFVIVTLVVTGVLLVGWRSGLAAVTPQVLAL